MRPPDVVPDVIKMVVRHACLAQVVHREELGDNAAAVPELAAGATKIDASNQYTNTQPSE